MILLLTSVHAWSSPPIIPGELIVKFPPDSKYTAAVANANRTTPPDFETLKPATVNLQTRSGVPLQPVRIFSDQRVLFSIDVHTLTNDLKSQLTQQSTIATVQEEPQNGVGATSLFPQRKLKVSFVIGSKESELLAQYQKSDQRPLLDQLISNIGKDFGLPLKGDISETSDLMIWINFTSLTLSLAERLNRDPEIESAQPNYLLTFR